MRLGTALQNFHMESDMSIHRCLLAPCLASFLLMSASASAQLPVINEFMASNATTIADDDGDYSDWIELYNPAYSVFDLTGCYLSDDAGNPLRWRFPGGIIPPRGFLLIWASNKDRQSPTGELHTNFAISAGGETLLLTAADGATRLDESPSIALSGDLSHGRLPDGADTWVTFGVTTPAASNEEGLQHLAAPALSLEPGYFTSAIDLTLTVPDPEALVTYTLDGSVPTELSTPFTAPIQLSSRTGDPNGISLIPTNYINPSTRTGWREPRSEVFKINVVRARAFRPGFAPSAVTTGSFIIDPNPAGRIPVPVVSLATAPENLFDDAIGIYVPGDTYVPGNEWSGNYYQRGDEWERPIHVELFDMLGNRIMAQDAGVRIHGEYTRRFPQKTLRLHANSQYGSSYFNCPLLPELPYSSYKFFLLRNSGNDWLLRGFLDLCIQNMVASMGFDTQAGRPVIHFINGEYWGLANLRERLDRHYIVRRYSVPEEEVAFLCNNAIVEDGIPSDRDDYLALRSYVASSDMTQPANLAYVEERMDLDNYIAYQVAEIYTANHDWPGNNIRYWRRRLPAYNPAAPPGHDGRWRWIFYDLDYSFLTPSHNTLAVAAADDGVWPNPPWSTELLRGLLENESFRRTFINAFSDHLNTTFQPARLIGIIDQFADLYAPAIPDWYDRWSGTSYWANEVQVMRNFVNQRPGYLRQHVRDRFSLAGTATVTLDVNDPAQGSIRINALTIDQNTIGLPDPVHPYPWTGTYFQGVPITVAAVPEPGYRFLGWEHDIGLGDTLTITPGAEPIALTAIFVPAGTEPVVVHAWHFNNLPSGVLTEIAADVSLLGGASITYPGSGAGYLDRVDGTVLGALPDTPAGYALRVRNPSDTRELVVTLPSTGHEDLTLGYAATRTVNGAQEHSVFCRVEQEGEWLPIAEGVMVSEAYQYFSHDLSATGGTADNPHLVVKFVFGGTNASGTSGNQRFDNLTCTGTAVQGANLPPQVAQPVSLQLGIEGGQHITVDIAGVFSDPESDPMMFSASSSDPATAEAHLSGNELTIIPLLRGEASITLSATDGRHDPVSTGFRVLIFPAAAVLADSAFAFAEWDPNLPERTYPEHMLFLQSAVNDPGVNEPLLYAYYIPHEDYAAGDSLTIGFPYNNTARTRINGLGENGISFINTGRGRDLGGALLALDTRDMEKVEVSWLAGTVLPNYRIYAIRLQYRIGMSGDFADLLIDGQPVEYLRDATPGHVQSFDPLELPADLLGRPYVQLLWRYYHVEVTSGARAELRLDDIQVVGSASTTGVEPPPLPTASALHGNAPNPFNPATVIRFSVRFGEVGRLEIYNSRGQRIRSLGQFPAGYHRLSWDGTNDAGRRCTSGVYFCRLSTPSGSWSRKILMLR